MMKYVEICSHYDVLLDVVELIAQLGLGSQLVKMDLKDAYRMIPAHPDDQHLLAIAWEGWTYVDRALLSGLCSAPKVFSAVADAIAWILFSNGVYFVLHYIDFLFIRLSSSIEAAVKWDRAMTIFQDLRVSVATHKTEGPASCVTFLGIVIDTEFIPVAVARKEAGLN